MIVAVIINFILGMIMVLPIREHLESKSDFMFVHMPPGLMYSYFFVYNLVAYIVYALIFNTIIIHILKKFLKKKDKKLNLILYWLVSIFVFLIPLLLYFRSYSYSSELISRELTVF